MKINKRTLTFEIIITVIMLVALITVFLPYFSLKVNDLNETFHTYIIEDVFEKVDSLLGEGKIDASFEATEDGKESVYIINPKSGLQTLKSTIDMKDSGVEQIVKMKRFIITMLIIAWTFAVISIVLIWVLRKKLRYILSGIATLISSLSMLSIVIFLPNLAKDALIAAIKKALFDDGGILQVMLSGLAENLVFEHVGNFVKALLMNTLEYGYWMFFIVSMLGFVAALIGFILELVFQDNVQAKKTVAKLLGLSGEYDGAEIEIGNGIVIGRDPSICQLVINKDKISRQHCRIKYNSETGKYLVTDYSSNGTYVAGGGRLDENVTVELEKGTIIQLGKKGDTFRLS